MYAQIQKKPKRKQTPKSSSFPIQRQPKEYYINGITHLVYPDGSDSLFNGREGPELTDGTKIVIEDSDQIWSRRGPNQEIGPYHDQDKKGERQYIWFHVLSVGDTDCSDLRAYVRQDALIGAPYAGSSVLPYAPSFEATYLLPGRNAYDGLPVSERAMNRVARGYNSYDCDKKATPHIAIMEMGNQLFIAGNTTGDFSFENAPVLLTELRRRLVCQEEGYKNYYGLKKHNIFIENLEKKTGMDMLGRAEIPGSELTAEAEVHAFYGAYRIIKNNLCVLEGYDSGQLPENLQKMVKNTKKCVYQVALAVKMYIKLFLQKENRYHQDIQDPLMGAVGASLREQVPVINVTPEYLTEKYLTAKSACGISYNQTHTHQHGEMLLLDILFFDEQIKDIDPSKPRQRLTQIFIGGALLDCLFCHWAHALFNEYVGPRKGIQVVTSGTHGSVPPTHWRVPLWMRAVPKALDDLRDRIMHMEGWNYDQKGYLFRHANSGEKPLSADLAPDKSDSDEFEFF